MTLKMIKLWLLFVFGLGLVRGHCDCRKLSELSDEVSELRSILQTHAEWFRHQHLAEGEVSSRSAGGTKRQNIIQEQMKLLLANLNAEVTTLRQNRLPNLEERISSIESKVVQEPGNPEQASSRSNGQHAAILKIQESIEDLRDQTFMARETLNVFGDILFAKGKNDWEEKYRNQTARMSSMEEMVNQLAEEVAIVSDIKLQRLESSLKRMESQQQGFSRLDRFIFEQMKVLLTNLNDKMTNLLQKRLPQLESAVKITNYL